ncbi:AAA family ATPase [Flavobacterium sp. MXW15]|uniref:AAA family ATPase n=1 Tax=Xanthomonas chitinilytica TaxID=2989819 RepID=A0ABT3JZE4_9XANT|nr:AAA family ATPase [Xanthomonas sp. H13-6]MCW4455985.1 AAA family ATPase [Flavobacterium sp. MXW15]MCW4473584.1 AAA family ATPase [Xanthomonas sp. H13-6]
MPVANLPERFGVGLVVGKFCPLHLGHERLIEHALAHCRQVVVLSWSKPEFAGCGPERRERWLAERFPQAVRLVLDDARLVGLCRQRGLPLRGLPDNGAPDAGQRAFAAWLCSEVLDRRIEAVFTSEDYGDGFAAALSAHFDARYGPAAPVRHVCLDPARSVVPVSGTAVRADPHAHRELLSPQVYADFVQRVAFVGGESSGKTTLARALAARYGSCWAPEYGRELWEAQGGRLDEADLLRIARVQAGRERALAAESRRWLFCDTTPLTTLGYSLSMFGRADPALQRLAERRYHALFLCAPDIPFDQDGTRRDAAFRERQHRWYLQQLERRGWAHTLLRGSLDERIAQVAAVLERLPASATVEPAGDPGGGGETGLGGVGATSVAMGPCRESPGRD